MIAFRRFFTVVFIVASSSGSFAAGDCRDIKSVPERLNCVEKRIEDVGLAVEKLKAEVGSRPDASAVQAMIANSLTGVKIDWAAHPSVCLFFADWTTKAERVPFSVQGCEGPNFVSNIHK